MNMAAALARTVLASVLAAGVVASDAPSAQYDVVVWACTPAGFAAALGAKAAGAKRVVVIEPTSNVGGMAAAGGIGLRDCITASLVRCVCHRHITAGLLSSVHVLAWLAQKPVVSHDQLHSWHGMNHLAIACMKGHSRHS
jgi:Zn-dependent alcohol dehydrogenase